MSKFACASAAALAFALLWLLCSWLIVIWPDQAKEMAGHMVHMDMIAVEWTLTPRGFFIGLVLWAATAFIAAWLIAAFYNVFRKG